MKVYRLIIVFASLSAAACMERRPASISACPVGPDASHPSDGPLQVLPSEVPDVALDSMQWHVRTGDANPELGIYTFLSVSGRIVATRLVSLVGVGVLVEGLRDSTVVHRMIDSEFFVARNDPIVRGVGTVVELERVRPERPVPVRAGERVSGLKASPAWGCPTRARIIRLASDTSARREARIPDDERPTSDLYEWDPRTFSVDSALANQWGAYALLEGPEGEKPQTDFVIVRSKILYRTTELGELRADSARIELSDASRLAAARNSVLLAYPRWPPAPVSTESPGPGMSALFIRQGTLLAERRFPTHDPPADVVPLVTVLSEIRARLAQRTITAPERVSR